jgi:hypothetical protein
MLSPLRDPLAPEFGAVDLYERLGICAPGQGVGRGARLE